MTRMLSGHPEGAPEAASTLSGHDLAVIGPTFTSFRLPFGLIHPANLTPDAATGLGNWTERCSCARCVRVATWAATGAPSCRRCRGRTWPSRATTTLKAIFAYLRAIPGHPQRRPGAQVPDQVMNGIAAGYDKMLAG
jgi:hypothetical protein